MSVTAPRTRPAVSRRARAARIVDAAARGGLIGTVAAGLAWLLAGAIAGTAFFVLLIASLAAAAVLIWRGSVASWVWLALAAAWAAVLLEREIVGENGGVWVALAGWIGVIVAARRAGISKWALPLLAYPAISVAIVVLAGEDVLDPWGTSWLWVLAILGPVVGVRTLLNPSPRQPAGRASG
jgi:hypothetical protein